MKKIFILSIILLFVLVGCNNNKPSVPKDDTNKTKNELQTRFVYTGEKYKGGFYIVKDKDTGVKYIFYEKTLGNHLSYSAMTPLLDSEGKIVIEKGE
jgi:uncharacterized lipoprotein NlpE involved in copper resistance